MSEAAPITHFLPLADKLINREEIASGEIKSARFKSVTGWIPPQHPPGPQPSGGGHFVITAIIDDMVNLAHRQFPASGGQSRINFAWIPELGREIDRTDIEGTIATHAGDEERIMRAMGLIDYRNEEHHPLAARMNHGTAVASLAAGMDPRTTAPWELYRHRIITIAIPRQVTLDTTGYTLATPFINALWYVLQRAREMGDAIGQRIPVVVNFSYGIAGGPHDGGHLIKRAARALINSHAAQGGGPVTLTLPSGNANLGRGHRRGDGGEKTLELALASAAR